MNNVVRMTSQNAAVAVVIPARIASTRYPNKMLVEVEPGITLIEKVYQQCCEQHPKEHVWVATDSREIADIFGDAAIMTSEECQNGTERVAEASLELTWYEHFINIQGDMIDVPKNIIPSIASFIQNNDSNVVTIIKEMNKEDRNNPSTVKCINNGYNAHWFCRAPLEYGDWHLGIYGYTRGALFDYANFESYEEEHIESLEQLRWLQNLYNIDVLWTNEHAAEINTPEDLIKWQHKIRQN